MAELFVPHEDKKYYEENLRAPYKDSKSIDFHLFKAEKCGFPFCPDVSKFQKITKIGQGTFGEVFKAKHKVSGKIVALKKVLMENEKEGFPITALREIKILQLLKHDNVVDLIEICRSLREPPDWSTKDSLKPRSSFYLVFEFCEHDLAGLLSNSSVDFKLAYKKQMMKHLLNGLYYLHSNKILHRDMKSANILITQRGILKIADFGLARSFSSNHKNENRFTNKVITLWYRPADILLGERNYGPDVDLWGAGCIMAEFWTRTPIMQGSTEHHQLTLISQLCGSITPETLPGVEKLKLFKDISLQKNLKRKVRDRLKAYIKNQDALDLLDKLLTLDPKTRIDSDAALDHSFFYNDPMPEDFSPMLASHRQSMFEYMSARKKNQLNRQAAQPGLPRGQPTANDGQYHDHVF